MNFKLYIKKFIFYVVVNVIVSASNSTFLD